MATYNVTIIFWVPVVAGVLLIAWSQISMRPKGLRITEDNLILSPWTSPQSIPLDDIESIQCGSPDDSAGLQVRMRSGRIFKISRLDSPPVATFRTILADIAIPVKQS